MATGGRSQVADSAVATPSAPPDLKDLKKEGQPSVLADRSAAADSPVVAKDLPQDFLDRMVTGDVVAFTLPDGREASGGIEMIRRDAQGVLCVQGRLTQPNPGYYFFQRQTSSGVAGLLVGNVRFDGKDEAWKIEPLGIGGTPQMLACKLDDVICAKYDKIPEAVLAAQGGVAKAPQTHPTNIPIPSYQTVIPLQSLPGATGVLYLDFDGETGPFQGWGSFDAAPSGASNSEVFDVWKMVSEDYQGFNLNVTTDRKVFDNAPQGRRQHCMITPTTTAAPGAGGVSYIGSYNWSGDTVNWAFYYIGKAACEVITHEIGHALNLGHDGRINPSEGYYGGHGSGPTGWAPIMGVGYYQNLSQWSKGEYLSANQTEDDLYKIAYNNNNVGYRPDDCGDTLATAKYLEIAADNSVSNEGIIETTGDIDAFRFVTTGGLATLNVNTVTLNPNLDIHAEIVTAATGAVVASDNADLAINAAITATLPAGEYLLRVRGTGRGDPLLDGYTDYGSLGSYLISGSVVGGIRAECFSIAENTANGTAVGTVAARINHGAAPLTYAIASGNLNGAFSINPSTGAITVTNSSVLDFEALSLRWDDPATIEMFVTITDSNNPSLNENLRTVVTVADVNEPPVITDGAATLHAYVATGTNVFQVTSSDPDHYDIATYSISEGNAGNAFAIDANTGQITVSGSVSFTLGTVYTLIVQATDQGTPVRQSTATVIITIAAGWSNPAGGSWPLATNWYGNAVANGAGVSADFSALDLTSDTTVTLDGSRTLGGLKFGDATPSHNWTLATGTGGTLTLQVTSGSPVINVVNQTATLGTALGGGMGLTKSGAGTLVLAGTNTYSGDTVISAGTLCIGNGGTTGNLGGAAVINHGTLEFYRSDSPSLSLTISGDGDISIKPAGSYTFSGALTCGSFRFDGSGSRTVTFNGSAANAINQIEDSQDGHGNLIFGKSAGTHAFSGPVLDVGSGYASQFVVRLGNHQQISDTTTVKLYGWNGEYGGSSRFLLNGFNETIAGLDGGSAASSVQNTAATPSVLTLAGSGTYSITGGIENGGSGTLSLIMNGVGLQTLAGSRIAYTGTTAVTQGTLRLSQATGFASSTTTVTSPGILELASTDTAVDNWWLNTVLAGAGVIQKTGAGWVQTHTNAHTFSGTVNILAGTLGTSYLTSNWSAVTADFNISAGALLDARGQAITLGGLNGAGRVGTTYTTTATVTLGADNKSGAFSGVICGNASSAANLTDNPNAGVLNLIKTGTGTQMLAGSNTYTGTTSVNGGVLELTETGTLAFSPITVKNAATLKINTTGKTLSALEVENGSTVTLPAVAGGTTTVTNALTLTSNPSFTVRPSFSSPPQLGNTCILLTPASISGTAGAITTDFLTNGATRVRGSTAVSGGKLVLAITTGGDAQTWNNGAHTGIWACDADANFTGPHDGKFMTYDNITFGDTAAGTVTLVGNLNPGTVSVNSAFNYTFAGSGFITGGCALTKSGAGTLTLTGSNSYTGGTTIHSGTFEIGGAGQLGSGNYAPNITNNGTLAINSTANQTLGGTLSGNGSLTKSNAGTLTLTGANTYSGGTTITSGTLATANDATLGTGAITIGVIGTYAFSTTGGYQPSFANAVSGAGAFNVTGSSGNQSFWSGDFSGFSGTLTIGGSCSWWARSSNTGSTTMKLNLSGALGFYDNESNITRTFNAGALSGGAEARIWGNPDTGNAITLSVGALNTSITFAGIMMNNWASNNTSILGLTKVGTGTLTLTGANSYTGPTTINQGVVTLSGSGTLSSTSSITIASGATLNLGGSANNQIQINRNGTGTLIIDGTLSVTSATAHTMYPNTITLNNGTLTSTNGAGDVLGAYWISANRTITANGASNTIGGAGKIGISGGVNLTLDTPLLTDSVAVSTVLQYQGGVAKSGLGTMNLTGTNTYSGGTTVNGGTLSLSGAGGPTGVIRGNLTINAGATVSADTGSGQWALGYGSGTAVNHIVLNGGTLNFATTQDSGTAATSITMTGGAITGQAWDWYFGLTTTPVLNTLATDTTAVISSNLRPRLGTGGTLTFNVAAGTVTGGATPGVDLLMSGPLSYYLDGGAAIIKDGAGVLQLTGSNTYTGPTTINQGVVTLGGSGSLPSTSSITIASGATLTLGGSSNNQIQQGFTRDSANAASLAINGTLAVGSAIHTMYAWTIGMTNGTISFTNANGYLWMPDRTITINGTNTISGTSTNGIYAAMGNVTFDTPAALDNVTVSVPVSGTGVTKSGLGTMTLSGANTYTGNTTVNAGTLILTDDAGAQLAFTIGANGVNNKITGAGAATLNGKFSLNLTGADPTATNSWTLVDVTAPIYGTSFSLVGFTEAPSGVHTYNDGTHTWTFTEASGNLTVAANSQPGYADWAATHAPTGTSADDYDNDGVSNGAEWVLGGTKDANDLDKLPKITTSEGDIVFTFHRAQQSKTPDTALSIQVGTTLDTWPDVYEVPNDPVANNPGVTVVDNLDGFDVVTLRIPRSPDSSKFARLRVAITP